jgi:hypothetical protein
MTLSDTRQYEYYKLTKDYAGKSRGEVFKVSLEQNKVNWFDQEGSGNISLELNSPLLEKLPDLNISEFRYKDSEIFKRIKLTNKYRNDSKEVFTLDEIVDNSDFTIHAVKNSMGIEFSVGERTSQGTIQNFEIQRHNEIHAMFNDGKNYADVNTLEKIYITSDKVLINWSDIEKESIMGVDEWILYLKHNHDTMLLGIGLHNKTIADCYDKFHYTFLKGPLQDFFKKFDFDLTLGANVSLTHHNYVIKLPDGRKKRNAGFDEFGLPLFPTTEHAHAAAVRSMFQHLHNLLMKKSQEKLQIKS